MVLDLELRANINKMRRQQKTQEQRELEERQRLQQEILSKILKPAAQPTQIEERSEVDSFNQTRSEVSEQTERTIQGTEETKSFIDATLAKPS